MPTPLLQLLPQIVALNVVNEPFSYYAEGNLIIGWWDIAKCANLYPKQAHQADQSYRLTITLNEGNGTFNYNETRNSATWGTGYDEDGFRTHGKARSSGKRIQKGFSFTLGGPKSDQDTVGNSSDAIPFPFQEERIKAPVFNWLEYHGWNHANVIGKFFAP